MKIIEVLNMVAEDIIERKGDTLIWQGTHAITVKESPEQITKKLARKLAKQTKEM